MVLGLGNADGDGLSYLPLHYQDEHRRFTKKLLLLASK